MANYVRVKLDDELPQIILGEEGGDFKVVITNKAIDFLEGTTKAAYISNQSLNIPRAVIENELQQGGFKWVVRKDINGKPRNMGLVWKGDGV